MTAAEQHGAIGFAERVLELLDEGRFTATYKYAVLLALIDVCLERTEASGMPPDVVTTRQLADKIVEIYWLHSLPFAGRHETAVLRQNITGQAEIISAIARFRARHAPDASASRWHARISAPGPYETLVRRIEWKLIEMPLPRLQVMGQVQSGFIYEIAWDQGVARSDVARYQSGDSGMFDNRLLLRPGVGEYLLQLNGLLRPLIQRRWSAMVAQVNRLEDSQLEMFLFGANRTPTARIRVGLWEMQSRRCFYCDDAIRDPALAEVDHFIPWSRYPDDGIDNLVVADHRCNGLKSSSLAASEHVARWSRRLQRDSTEYVQLADLSVQSAWDRHDEQSHSVARAIYVRLPADAKLWLRGKDFVTPEPEVLACLFTSAARPTAYQISRIGQ